MSNEKNRGGEADILVTRVTWFRDSEGSINSVTIQVTRQDAKYIARGLVCRYLLL